MAKKYRWLKITGAVIGVVLFFLIVNSFFRENNRLLAERNTWQERAKRLEEDFKQLETENRELQYILDQGKLGLIITRLDFETLVFSSSNRLSYQLIITVENKSTKPIPAGKGDFMFAFHRPGTESFQRTFWRRTSLSPFKPGEVKTISLSGEVSAAFEEEMLLIVSLDQQPGVAKKYVRLADLNTKEEELPQ